MKADLEKRCSENLGKPLQKYLQRTCDTSEKYMRNTSETPFLQNTVNVWFCTRQFCFLLLYNRSFVLLYALKGTLRVQRLALIYVSVVMVLILVT